MAGRTREHRFHQRKRRRLVCHGVPETNWSGLVMSSPCQHRANDLAFEHKSERAYADALGCGWMTAREGRQAIPPAYTELIGHQLITHVRQVAA